MPSTRHFQEAAKLWQKRTAPALKEKPVVTRQVTATSLRTVPGERTSLSLAAVIPLTPMLVASSYLKSCAASFPAKREISRKQRRFTDYTLLPSASLLICNNS